MDSVNTIAAPAVDGALVLSGPFQRPQSLNLEGLQRYDSVTARPFDLRCYTTNRFIRSVDAYRGVRPGTLIAEAG
ncbi:hypothetical protein [Paraburkholderia fynbosensis]|uniref:Uncharacterized protein n=1 Tax=Paraburkholderia fynbosensis TaxID=1200993 RepID=A0A6J5G4Z0_9BURK|nr:hypothetical protein LMG27177_03519 [Paraburkholderia fynbosensis]